MGEIFALEGLWSRPLELRGPEYSRRAALAALYAACKVLVNLGYFLGLSKSVFCLIPAKKEKFLILVRQVLGCSTVSVKTLQRLVGKCVSFSLAVPAALLFTREVNLAISKGMRTNRLVKIDKNLRDEIAHWLFLETWDDPLPWKEERHLQISLSSDASGSGWGATMKLSETITISGLMD